jgi:hypothetical protein
MALPCEALFNALETAKEASDRCWAEVDGTQGAIAGAAAVTTIACIAAVGAKGGNKFANTTCAAGAFMYLRNLDAWLDKMDHCNELDLDAYASAKAFEKCAGEHKEFLNSRLQPTS